MEAVSLYVFKFPIDTLLVWYRCPSYTRGRVWGQQHTKLLSAILVL